MVDVSVDVDSQKPRKTGKRKEVVIL